LDSEALTHTTFSDRELHVFKLIVAGESLTAIANKLSLSVKTVSTYRSRILEKMDMKNNAQLVRYAIQHRLVE
jgi:two-component system invasion response regulator UvrY